MMKRTIITIAAVLTATLAISSTALADAGDLKPTFMPGIEMQLGKDGHELQLSLSACFSASRVVGGSCFSFIQAESKYAEMVCGPSFMADKNLKVALYAGMNTAESDFVPLVGGASVYLTEEAGDLFMFAQYAYDGFWYTATGRLRVGCGCSRLKSHVGLMSQRYAGEGLYADVVIGRLTVYAAGLYNIEQNALDRSSMDAKYVLGLLGLTAYID